ncbi:hypothetical protein PR202_ga20767 [Eleusine coracana subsp. coracana]|uniref:Disease resistance N-terminal domain-containing protein n=1 Tax=Eleusine coracana subsp. coracana TaxID=191504 RepID=A0AAV5CYL9_ELECO|nr:hypothetical protein QOZ80_8AG0627980 [Eleusine coracana subsp. coracana]GJN03335.1 hypothetical protein PR202_ga20767 [Eleusine coracana subsp. coracana]
MEKFLVSAATGALNPVLEKLAAVLGDEDKCFKGMRGEVKSLTEELGAMHAFLKKMSEEESPDTQDRAWIKEVLEFSYDIEDSLDDFMIRVDDKSTKPDNFINKCKNLITKTMNHSRIAKAIQYLKAQVKEVG